MAPLDDFGLDLFVSRVWVASPHSLPLHLLAEFVEVKGELEIPAGCGNDR